MLLLVHSIVRGASLFSYASSHQKLRTGPGAGAGLFVTNEQAWATMPRCASLDRAGSEDDWAFGRGGGVLFVVRQTGLGGGGAKV